VLFADIKGSMELAADVDPEEWHRIMDRFFAILAQGVHRFEGTINQFTGDGIMALFGAPIAHEDHAQRACYAALYLSDELRRYADQLRVERGLNFSVRMGLNSGEVIVGKIGDDLRMDYTAQGPTVGLAARMEQIAAPGRVCLTQHTARLIEGFFRLRGLGPSKVKGVAEPLQVYELEGVGPMRSRLDVAQSRGLLQFVGRADEMAALQTALQRALEGNGQVVGIVGEAGVGKSRLCLEFVERARARGVPVYEAHCPSYGKTVPFLPVFALLRGYFGIAEPDSDATARQKIAGRLVLLDPSFEELLPVVFDFLGVADPERPSPQMSAEARHRQLFCFVRRLMQPARTSSEPGVMLIDDLHWIDAGSDAVLSELVEAITGSRTLLLANFRPEYHADWLRKSYYQQLPLMPLGPDAIEVMLGDLLGQDPSVVALPELIRQRTGGNPFYIEEVVNALVESGSLAGARGAYRLARTIEEIEIPDTVQSLLAARIDRLAEREKQVLQTAAVIGKKFSGTVLKEIAELPNTDLAASLSSLQRAEFIYEEAIFPEAEYVFKHPLTHEVAYGSQLAERRRRTHAAAAEAMAKLNAERQDEQAALLAHHWEQAGEVVEAARWHARAAGWLGYRDVAESVRHWQKVYALLEPLPLEEDTATLRMLACVQILVVGGWRLGFSEDEEQRLFDEGRRLATDLGDTRFLAMLMQSRGVRLVNTGDARGYVEHALEASRLADRTGDPELRCVAHLGLVYSHWGAGRLREALEFLERGLELVGDDLTSGVGVLGFSIGIWLRVFRGAIENMLGRLEQGRLSRAQGLQLARERGDTDNLGWGKVGAVFDRFHAGEVAGAKAHAQEALELAEKHGAAHMLSSGFQVLGLAQLLNQEWDEAIESFERSLEIARSHRTALENESSVLAKLAEACLGAGQSERARCTADEAIRVAQAGGFLAFEIEAQLAIARTLLAGEGTAARSAIEQALSRGLELVKETGASGLEPPLVEVRARLCRRLGDERAYRRDLRGAQRLYVEIGATGHARRIAEELVP
jgi:class 3 adenylate cyclase/tetratricopeptide (TPR) repeat protein